LWLEMRGKIYSSRRDDGKWRMNSTVPSGRIYFETGNPAQCAGLISDVPSGQKRGGKAAEELKKFLEARSNFVS